MRQTHKCIHCGYLNPIIADSCVSCEKPLDSTISNRRTLQEKLASFQAGHIIKGGDLILTEPDTGFSFQIPYKELTQVSIGRSNTEAHHNLTVNLTLTGKNVEEISRYHAMIHRHGRLLLLTDKRSTNGTFLNEKRLAPEQSRVIREHDSIRFANITLRVSITVASQSE